jgi:hypothetical protein
MESKNRVLPPRMEAEGGMPGMWSPCFHIRSNYNVKLISLKDAQVLPGLGAQRRERNVEN